MRMKKSKILILSVLSGIFIMMGIVAAFSLETPATSGTYPIGATINLNTGKMEVTLSDNSKINFTTSINTQNGNLEEDYNYFVFPKVYADENESYYSYIGTDNYRYILTGWKVDSEYSTYFGYTDSNVNYYSEIGGYDAMWEPTVNVYQSDDWVDISKMISENKDTLSFTPVYGKCIYIKDPFENIYYDGNLYLSVLNPNDVSDNPADSNYIKNVLGFNSVDEYKEFLYYYTRKNIGASITGSEAWKKYISFYDSSITEKGFYYSPAYSNKWTGASDKNDGHDEQSSVATLDRAYELVTERKDFSPYHYVFYMLSNLHEIRVYNGSGKSSTNFNYSNGSYTYDATGSYTKTMSVNGSDNTYYAGLTNKYKGATFTSATGTRYSLVKRIATYSQAWASSVRFDNVEYKNLAKNSTEIGNNTFSGQLSFGSEENLLGRNSNTQKIYQVCEFTRKSKTNGWSTFRTNGAKAITLNGTSSTSLTVHHSWGSSINYLDQTVFNVGGNQNVGNFYTGTMTTNSTTIGTVNGNVIVNIIENATISNFYGGCRNQKFQQTGDREINIRGGKITNLYGAGHESILNGDININVTAGTIGNLYGGGQEYMATVYGNITLNVANATITGSIYGGGKYASVIQGFTGSLSLNAEKERVLTETPKANTTSGGEVKINLLNTKINGNVYGSGQGMVNTVTKMLRYSSISYGTEYDATSLASYVEYVNNLLDNCDSNSSIAWWNDEVKSPVSNEDGSITSYVYRSISAQNPASVGSSNWSWRISLYSVDYYLSVAAVQNSNINILGTTVIDGNVYGGGNLGVVEGDISINISENSEIKGTLYGGGDGTSSIATVQLYNAYNGVLPKFVASGTTVKYANTDSATSTTQINLAKSSSAGTFSWTNDIRLKESTKFNGIYKGSSAYTISELTEDEKAVVEKFGDNKYVYSSSYEEVGEVYGDITVKTNGGTINTLHGGCNRANVTGKIDVSLLDGNINTVYGGNNIGGITYKDITIKVGNEETAPNILNLYGGGNLAVHDANINISVDNLSGTMDYLFGGGHAANVNGSTNVEINYGTYNYVFGGGDLAKVLGDTYVNVGDKVNNPIIKVNNVVYGGGRGSDTGEDASGIITVEGSSTVWIVGMNTSVQNYGSTKLGSVLGDVNVTFDTYRKENSTNPYVTMNGIDRATTVSLINSYIALENIGENGEKEGIKNIKNLNVPSGSGLKMTATGEITGDFSGGGVFYLDSKVSLTIGGNISGTTTLVINPQVSEAEDNVETPLVIKGTLVYAYMIVKGNSNENNLVCTDSRYADKVRYTFENSTGYFYLESDIPISEQINEILVSKKDINYSEDSSAWGEVLKVEMQQDGIVTTNMSLTYNFAVANDDDIAYQKVSRTIAIKESSIDGGEKYFPVGTLITMIVDGEYYKYTVKEDAKEIYLSDFLEMEDSSTKYNEIKDVKTDENTIIQGKTSSSIIYSREENFRFVVDFTYCSNPLPANTYIIYLSLKNDETEINAENLLAENIIDLQLIRAYSLSLDVENRNYVERDKISIKTNIKIDALKEYEINKFIDTPLYSRIIIKDSGDNLINLPSGTVIRLEDKSTTLEGGVARLSLIDALSGDAYDEDMDILIDMSAVKEYSLKSEEYTILFEAYLKDDYAEKILTSQSFEINFVRPEGGTIEIDIDNNDLVIDSDKTMNLKLNYFGDIHSPYIKVKLQKRNASLEYIDTDYSVLDVSQIDGLKEEITKDIALDFSDIPVGYYRVCFEIYGYKDILYSASAFNVEVK